MTIEQLKAQAYDIMRQLELLQVELRKTHQEIQRLEVGEEKK